MKRDPFTSPSSALRSTVAGFALKTAGMETLVLGADGGVS